MLWVGILAGLMSIALFICVMAFGNKDCANGFIGGILAGVFMFTSVVCLVDYYNPHITPMDVYQGKTTLQYKVVDDVKVDSIVIWKE